MACQLLVLARLVREALDAVEVALRHAPDVDSTVRELIKADGIDLADVRRSDGPHAR